MPDAKRVQYRIFDRTKEDRGDERARVIAALVETPARIEPKYFYDELGCALYGAICRLPEYYPTRTEAALFREHRADVRPRCRPRPLRPAGHDRGGPRGGR